MAKIVHALCGNMNGWVWVKIADKMIKFDLITPQYSGRSAYQISTEFEIKDFIEEGNIPACINPNIELSEKDEIWWLNASAETEERYEVVGGNHSENQNATQKDRVFSVFDNSFAIIPFSDIEHKGNFKRDSFEKLMFALLKIFYHWYNDNSFKRNVNDVYL